MIVSPSRAQALVDAVVPNVSVLYEVVSFPTFRYRLVFADWTVPAMLKYSDDDSGPITAMDSGNTR